MSSRDLELLTLPDGPPASGYSQVAITSTRRLAFISGQVGVDARWRLAAGFSAQADLAFRNLLRAVDACRATPADIAKLTIYLIDAGDMVEYCAVRDRHFASLKRAPASTLIVVAGLYSKQALIEIEAVVAIPNE